MPEPVLQLLLALCWYAALVVMMRLAGKRLAGQTTTFDLLVLITLGVVLQHTVLREGTTNALVFVITVFTAHRLLAALSAKSPRVRRLLRGAPRPLIRDGRIAWDALADESLSYDELMAGLRKSGIRDPREVRLATLEETGHISALPMEAEDGVGQPVPADPDRVAPPGRTGD
jgi:uncharacterized membrane protein YcaP (DUF421 family)